MSLPNMPNPTANPATKDGGTLRPEWVRFISLLLSHIAELEARIRVLEAGP